eukprot:6206654-Pleurochrysis_carterae.AAC.5
MKSLGDAFEKAPFSELETAPCLLESLPCKLADKVCSLSFVRVASRRLLPFYSPTECFHTDFSRFSRFANGVICVCRRLVPVGRLSRRARPQRASRNRNKQASTRTPDHAHARAHAHAHACTRTRMGTHAHRHTYARKRTRTRTTARKRTRTKTHTRPAHKHQDKNSLFSTTHAGSSPRQELNTSSSASLRSSTRRAVRKGAAPKGLSLAGL